VKQRFSFEAQTFISVEGREVGILYLYPIPSKVEILSVTATMLVMAVGVVVDVL
jgi:hypothetical protein